MENAIPQIADTWQIWASIMIIESILLFCTAGSLALCYLVLRALIGILDVLGIFSKIDGLRFNKRKNL